MVNLFNQLINSGSVVGLFFEVLPITCLAGIVYAVCRRRKIRKQGLRTSWGGELLRLLFVCYLTGLVNLVLVPANFWTYIWYFILNGYPGVELAPLFSGEFNFSSTLAAMLTGEYMSGSWVRTMLVGNVLMFTPMGFFLPLVFDRLGAGKLLAAAAAIPLAVELLQPIVGRSFDIDDIILNFAGILAGYAAAFAVKRIINKN